MVAAVRMECVDASGGDILSQKKMGAKSPLLLTENIPAGGKKFF